MAEIQIQYQELKDHIKALRNLADRLEDRSFVTTQLLNESAGNTCRQLNETYQILCEAEKRLKDFILLTADWLELAEKLFEETEKGDVKKLD